MNKTAAKNTELRLIDWEGTSCEYFVSADGHVFSKSRKNKYRLCELICWETHNGYLRVGLSIPGSRSISRRAHCLVLRAFRGKRPPGAVARHLNGDRRDNRINNLVWGTPKENSDDQIVHGTRRRGSLCSQAKLTESDVSTIRAELSRGARCAGLAKKYGVSGAAISQIKRRVWWKHVV